MLAQSKDQILSDLIIGLKRFRNTVRWKWVFQEEKRQKHELRNSPLSQIALDGNFSFNKESNEINEEDNNPIIIKKDEGLKSGPNPKKLLKLHQLDHRK